MVLRRKVLMARGVFLTCLIIGSRIVNCHTQIVNARRLSSYLESNEFTRHPDASTTSSKGILQKTKIVVALLHMHALVFVTQNWFDDGVSPSRRLGSLKAKDIEFANRLPHLREDPELGLTPSKTTQANKSEELLSWRAELCSIFGLGLPLAFSSAARILQGASNSIVLGRSNTNLLAAVSASFIWTQVTDNMVFTGIGQLSTLCSQAYGAGNKKLVGIWLQICLVFVTLSAIPILALRWCTSPILKLVGTSSEVADLAGKFTIWSQATFLFDMWYYSVQKYYAAQQIVKPDAVVDAIFIFVNVALVYLFVDVLRLGQDGVIGAALGTSLTRLLRLVVYVSYCMMKGYHRETWTGWSYKDIANGQRWKTLLKMMLPAGVGGLVENLQFQVCTLLTLHMGKSYIAAFNLALNLLILCFVNAIALGGASGIRMGRFLGAGKAAAARFTSTVGLTACSLGNLIFAFTLAGLIEPFSHMASHDVEVQRKLQPLRWTLSLAIALLGGFISLATILTTQGRPNIAAIIAPVMCWGVGFPVSYFQSKTRGLLGIFDGLNVGYGLAFISLLTAYCTSDWPKLCKQARKKAEKKTSTEKSRRNSFALGRGSASTAFESPVEPLRRSMEMDSRSSPDAPHG